MRARLTNAADLLAATVGAPVIASAACAYWLLWLPLWSAPKWSRAVRRRQLRLVCTDLGVSSREARRLLREEWSR